MKNNPCTSCKYNNTPEGVMVCDECVCDRSRKDRFTPMTNADRIRNMTDEELVKMLDIAFCECPPNMETDEGDYNCPPDCCREKCWLEWLKSPAESEGEK